MYIRTKNCPQILLFFLSGNYILWSLANNKGKLLCKKKKKKNSRYFSWYFKIDVLGNIFTVQIICECNLCSFYDLCIPIPIPTPILDAHSASPSRCSSLETLSHKSKGFQRTLIRDSFLCLLETMLEHCAAWCLFHFMIYLLPWNITNCVCFARPLTRSGEGQSRHKLKFVGSIYEFHWDSINFTK